MYYKGFIRKIFIRKDKGLVGHLQFMVGQKHNLVGHLILPQVFSVGRNIRCAFCLVGEILILVRSPISDRYFKTCKFTFSTIILTMKK